MPVQIFPARKPPEIQQPEPSSGFNFADIVQLLTSGRGQDAAFNLQEANAKVPLSPSTQGPSPSIANRIRDALRGFNAAVPQSGVEGEVGISQASAPPENALSPGPPAPATSPAEISEMVRRIVADSTPPPASFAQAFGERGYNLLQNIVDASGIKELGESVNTISQDLTSGPSTPPHSTIQPPLAGVLNQSQVPAPQEASLPIKAQPAQVAGDPASGTIPINSGVVPPGPDLRELIIQQLLQGTQSPQEIQAPIATSPGSALPAPSEIAEPPGFLEDPLGTLHRGATEAFTNPEWLAFMQGLGAPAENTAEVFQNTSQNIQNVRAQAQAADQLGLKNQQIQDELGLERDRVGIAQGNQDIARKQSLISMLTALAPQTQAGSRGQLFQTDPTSGVVKVLREAQAQNQAKGKTLNPGEGISSVANQELARQLSSDGYQTYLNIQRAVPGKNLDQLTQTLSLAIPEMRNEQDIAILMQMQDAVRQQTAQFLPTGR